MWPKTPTGCFFTALFVLVLIVVAGGAFGWLADFFIDPGSKVPDPGNIDVPGVR